MDWTLGIVWLHKYNNGIPTIQYINIYVYIVTPKKSSFQVVFYYDNSVMIQ